MSETLWSTIRHWWRSRRAWDSVGPTASGAALLRSAKILEACADIPQVNRCAGKDGGCRAFVQNAGGFCHRCDPSQLIEERMAREARYRTAAPKVATFRSKK